MRVSPPAHAPTRRARSLLGAAAVAILVLLALAGVKSYRDLSSARSREKLLADRIRETRKRIGVLERQAVRLRDDPTALEQLAREEHGLVYPGEIVLVLPEERSAGVPATFSAQRQGGPTPESAEPQAPREEENR